MNNALAGANLAFRYIAIGFVEEANSTLSDALRLPDTHPNVYKALSAASQQRETEDEALDVIRRTAVQQSSFFSRFADARFAPEAANLAFLGFWELEGGEIVGMSQEGDVVEGLWTEGARTYKLKAGAVGRTAKVESIRWDGPKGSYSFGSMASDGFMFVTADGQQISIMGVDNKDITFFTMKATSPPSLPVSLSSTN